MQVNKNINRRLNDRLDVSLDRPYGLLFSGTPPKAKPTPLFWQAWRREKEGLKREGYWVEKKGGQWLVGKRRPKYAEVTHGEN